MKIKECIALIMELKKLSFDNKPGTEKDEYELLLQKKLLKNIVPGISKLRKAKKVTGEIEEMISGSKYDEAVKLLRKAARHSKFWPLSDIKWSDLGAARKWSIPLTIFGIIYIIFAHNEIRYLKDSDNWPSTTGIVISTEIIENTDDDDYVIGYSPLIAYSYTVNGKSYRSDKFANDPYNREYERIDSIIKQHPVNSLITVYYHPQKHKISIIKKGFDTGFYFVFILVYGSFLAGLIIIILRIKKERSRIIKNDKEKKSEQGSL